MSCVIAVGQFGFERIAWLGGRFVRTRQSACVLSISQNHDAYLCAPTGKTRVFSHDPKINRLLSAATESESSRTGMAGVSLYLRHTCFVCSTVQGEERTASCCCSCGLRLFSIFPHRHSKRPRLNTCLFGASHHSAHDRVCSECAA